MNIEIKTNYENILVFTHDDQDGVIAAFILKYFFDNNLENEAWERNIDVICCEYLEKYNFQFFKNSVNEFIAKHQNDDSKITVYMLDYAIQPYYDMIKFSNFLKGNDIKFVWIDHHETAIQELADKNFEGISSVKNSAAYLTWQYLSDKPIPKIIEMISDYDCWNERSNYSFDNELMPTLYFILSLGNQLNDNQNNLNKTLSSLIENDNLIDNVISSGKYIYNYIKYLNNKNLSKIYNGMFQGMNCLIINSLLPGSKEFEAHHDIKNADLLIKWYFDGQRYNYSIYSTKADIDIGELCKKYLNGGGHLKSGGGYSDKLIFDN